MKNLVKMIIIVIFKSLINKSMNNKYNRKIKELKEKIFILKKSKQKNKQLENTNN